MAAMGWWEKSRIHQALKRLIAGPGIEVDSTTPSAPVVSAKISTDPSNALSFGTDDGLFATGGGGGSVPTGTGFTHITSGVQDAAAKAVDLATADVTGNLPYANLANGSACSVVGRSANSSGVVADISMGTNDRLLGRVSNVVGSTQLTAGMVPSALITSAMLRNSAGLSVIGRPAASSGAPSDIVSTGARTFLASSAANTAVTFRAIDTADFPTGDWIGANSGTGYAPSFTGISSDATWFDSGASITITAGTYLLSYSLRASMAITAGAGLISGRLYNVTDAAAVTNSEVMVVSSNIAGTTQGTGTASAVLTIAGTKTIRLEAQRDAGATYTGFATRTKSDAGGRTSISYVRIA